MSNAPRELEAHELSCLLDCKLDGSLSGDSQWDTLWKCGGLHSGYRTVTIRRLVGEGLLYHPVVKRGPNLGKPNPFVVQITAAGEAAIAAQVPDHPLLHTAEANRAKWRVIESE